MFTLFFKKWSISDSKLNWLQWSACSKEQDITHRKLCTDVNKKEFYDGECVGDDNQETVLFHSSPMEMSDYHTMSVIRRTMTTQMAAVKPPLQTTPPLYQQMQNNFASGVSLITILDHLGVVPWQVIIGFYGMYPYT